MLLGRIFRVALGSAQGAGTTRSETFPEPSTASLGDTAASVSHAGVPAPCLFPVGQIQDLLHRWDHAEEMPLVP